MVVVSQPFQNLGRYPLPFLRVAVKMIDSRLICSQTQRLRHIMKQHGKTQAFIRPDSPHGMKGVLSHAEAVVGIVLRLLHQAVKFRKHHRRDPRFPSDAQEIRIGACHKLCQLHLNALRAHLPEPVRMTADGFLRPLLNGKTKLGRKPHRAHDAQSVFLKPLVGLSHAADDLPFQILPASEQIHQSVFLIICHGVHREIPPLQILLQTGGKCHFLRMSAVLIFPVHPVGRHFIAPSVAHNRNRAVLDSRIDCLFKQGLRLLRPGGGGDVPVVRRAAKQGIPDAAAHRIGFVTRVLQNVKN